MEQYARNHLNGENIHGTVRTQPFKWREYSSNLNYYSIVFPQLFFIYKNLIPKFQFTLHFQYLIIFYNFNYFVF